MKQKDRRELRSANKKRSTLILNPEDTQQDFSPQITLNTPKKDNGHVDEFEMTIKGRGRGRPKKILITGVSSKNRPTTVIESGSKTRVPDFGLVTPETKQETNQQHLIETDVTNLTIPNQTTTDLSGRAALKRVVSTRPNKGFNSKYDTKTYLGLQNPPLLNNQTEGSEAMARPFSLVATSS